MFSVSFSLSFDYHFHVVKKFLLTLCEHGCLSVLVGLIADDTEICARGYKHKRSFQTF